MIFIPYISYPKLICCEYHNMFKKAQSIFGINMLKPRINLREFRKKTKELMDNCCILNQVLDNACDYGSISFSFASLASSNPFISKH